MPLPLGTDVEYIGQNASGGMVFGASATELIAFHGATATDQLAYTATVSTTVPVSVAGSVAFAYQTSAQFIAHIAATNAAIACLIEKGLMAAS